VVTPRQRGLDRPLSASFRQRVWSPRHYEAPAPGPDRDLACARWRSTGSLDQMRHLLLHSPNVIPGGDVSSIRIGAVTLLREGYPVRFRSQPECCRPVAAQRTLLSRSAGCSPESRMPVSRGGRKCFPAASPAGKRETRAGAVRATRRNGERGVLCRDSGCGNLPLYSVMACPGTR
jgi:hypothetical protein